MEDFYTIAVPLNEKGLEEVDFGISNSENVKEWGLTKEQRNSLLEKILYQMAVEYHIPYMDYDEETCIPKECVSDVNEILKDKYILFNQAWDVEGYNFLKEALQLAKEKKMPVYLFF